MNRLILSMALLATVVGCQSNREVFEEREMIKIHAENAQRAYHAGQWDRAVHQANKALELDDDHVKARTILGFAYMQVARFAKTEEARWEYCEKAEDTFSRAIRAGSETDPAVFKAYFGLGLVYFMWAQEVEHMMGETSEDEAEVISTDDSDTGESVWSE